MEIRIIARAGRSLRVIDHGGKYDTPWMRWEVADEHTADGDLVGYGRTEDAAIRDYFVELADIRFHPAECDAAHCPDRHCPYAHRDTWRVGKQHFDSEEAALSHAFPGEQFAPITTEQKA